MLNAPFDVSAKFGSTAIAFPFQTRTLNGVWPYTIIKIPKGISAVVALATAAQAAARRELMDAISHLLQDLRAPARQLVGLPGQVFTEFIVGIVCAIVISALIQLVALSVIDVVMVAMDLSFCLPGCRNSWPQRPLQLRNYTRLPQRSPVPC